MKKTIPISMLKARFIDEIGVTVTYLKHTFVIYKNSNGKYDYRCETSNELMMNGIDYTSIGDIREDIKWAVERFLGKN